MWFSNYPKTAPADLLPSYDYIIIGEPKFHLLVAMLNVAQGAGPPAAC